MIRSKKLAMFPADVRDVLGYSYSHSVKYVRKLKREFGKQPHQYVSITEFCSYSGISETEVRQVLKI